MYLFFVLVYNWNSLVNIYWSLVYIKTRTKVAHKNVSQGYNNNTSYVTFIDLWGHTSSNKILSLHNVSIHINS